MINRVLIRIKVVQMLYSHLLIENQFMLEPQPSAPTKEKRFAYSLYMDMLTLLVRVSESVERRGGSHPLADTRFIKRLMSDDKMMSALTRSKLEPYQLAPVLDSISSDIKESNLYKKYLKEGYDRPDATLWREILDKIVLPNEQLGRLIAEREDYTLRGVDRFRAMMEQTFTNFMKSTENPNMAVRELERSLDKARELYMRLLYLPVDLVNLRSMQIDDAQKRFNVRPEDRFPNMRFVDNELVAALRGNAELQEYVEKNGVSWLADDRRMLESLLRSIMESDIYAEYMQQPVGDMAGDSNFWRDIFRKVVFTNADFLETLENKSVFWNDDLFFEGDFAVKTFRRMANPDEENPILPQYKDEEDARFGSELFYEVVKHKEEYRSMIDEALNTKSWDTERLAFMDVVILLTAIAEIMNFQRVPLQVSVNEYIEIAKYYSTPKSGNFVNGILGGVIERLRAEGRLQK